MNNKISEQQAIDNLTRQAPVHRHVPVYNLFLPKCPPHEKDSLGNKAIRQNARENEQHNIKRESSGKRAVHCLKVFMEEYQHTKL